MSEVRVDTPHHGGQHHGSNGKIHTIVWHDEEFPIKDSSAQIIATMFAGVNHGDSCAHYVIDRDSENHCALDSEICYHAPPNMGTIGIERDGYASMSTAAWNAPAAQATTCRVAARTAELCVRHGLPPVWRTVAETAHNVPGVTSHANRSKAFGQSAHSDPGPAFPVAASMALVVKARMQILTPTATSAFQRAHGLVVDGDAGHNTVMALGAWLYNSKAGLAVPAVPGIILPVKAPIKAAPAPVKAAPAPVKAVPVVVKPPTAAPVLPAAPVQAPAPHSPSGLGFHLLDRQAGLPAVWALTADGMRVWIDAPWWKALVAAGVAGQVADLDASSNVWALPILGNTPR